MIDLVAVHAEMTTAGFHVTWDVDGDVREEAQASAVLTVIVHHPWGEATELSVVLTPSTTMQFARGGTGRRMADQRLADCAVDGFSVETVFPSSWLAGFRNEVAMEATLSIDGDPTSIVLGTGYLSSAAA
jgi:hypothetical protein